MTWKTVDTKEAVHVIPVHDWHLDTGDAATRSALKILFEKGEIAEEFHRRDRHIVVHYRLAKRGRA